MTTAMTKFVRSVGKKIGITKRVPARVTAGSNQVALANVAAGVGIMGQQSQAAQIGGMGGGIVPSGMGGMGGGIVGVNWGYSSSTNPTAIYTQFASTITSTSGSTWGPVIQGQIPIKADPNKFSNLELLQDAQDLYTDAVSRIKLLKTDTDTVIELPDGNELRCENGRYSFQKTGQDVKFLLSQLSETDFKSLIDKFYHVINEAFFFTAPDLRVPLQYGTPVVFPDGTTFVPENDGASWFLRDASGKKIYQSDVDLLYETEREFKLPDGAKFIHDGHTWRIDNSEATIIYKPAPVRDFSRFLNASEMLEQFAGYVKKLGLKTPDFLGLPLELFINWLILQAAEQDGDDVPSYVVVDKHPALLPKKSLTRCLNSGRFVSKRRAKSGILFASQDDMVAYAGKLNWA